MLIYALQSYSSPALGSYTANQTYTVTDAIGNQLIQLGVAQNSGGPSFTAPVDVPLDQSGSPTGMVTKASTASGSAAVAAAMGQMAAVPQTNDVTGIQAAIDLIAATGNGTGTVWLRDAVYTGFSSSNRVVMRSGINLIGVPPTLATSGVVPDQQWDASSGTRFVGDGSADCIGVVDGVALSPSLTGTTAATFSTEYIRGFILEGIEFSLMKTAVKMGATNRMGPVNGYFGKLYARDCSGPGFDIMNYMRCTATGEIWTFNCDGQRWSHDLDYTTLQPGNSILPNLYNNNLTHFSDGKCRKGIEVHGYGVPASSTYTGSINGTTLTVTKKTSGIVAVGQTLSGTGITASTQITERIGENAWRVSISQNASSTTITATISAYYTTGGVSHFGRPQSNQFESALADQTATFTNTDSQIAVTDIVKYRMDLPVYFTTTQAGFTANLCYFIVGIDYTAGKIQLALTVGGAPITASASTTATIKCKGFPGISGGGVGGGSKLNTMTFDAVDVEGQSTAGFYWQNANNMTATFQSIQTSQTQVNAGLCLRAVEYSNIIPSCGGLYYDADSGSSTTHIITSGSISTALNATLPGLFDGVLNLYGTAARGAGNGYTPTITHVNPGGLPWTYPGLGVGQRVSIKTAGFTHSTWEFGDTVALITANATDTMPEWKDTSATDTHVGGGGRLTNGAAVASGFYLTVNTNGTQLFNGQAGVTSLVLAPGETLVWRINRVTPGAYAGATPGTAVFVAASVALAPNWHSYPSYADDLAAAAGGVPIGGNYRSTSTIKKRVS